MFNKDVATGKEKTDSTTSYSSLGPASIFSIKNKVTPPAERYCYLWDMLETCTPEEKDIVASGRAIVKDFILLGYTAVNGTAVYYSKAAGTGAALSDTGNATSEGSNTTPGSGQTPTSSAAGRGVHLQDVWQVLLPLMMVVGLQVT